MHAFWQVFHYMGCLTARFVALVLYLFIVVALVFLLSMQASLNYWLAGLALVFSIACVSYFSVYATCFCLSHVFFCVVHSCWLLCCTVFSQLHAWGCEFVCSMRCSRICFVSLVFFDCHTSPLHPPCSHPCMCQPTHIELKSRPC